MTLYIFNPENDMALADGHAGYTPPERIRQMRRELWWLPQWWAAEDDLVWNGRDRLCLPKEVEIEPWGWSAALCHQLRQAGVEEQRLPSAQRLEHLRQLSHRQTAVALLAELREQLPPDGHFCGESTLCKTKEEAEEAIRRYGEAVLKMPWSSSGRGTRHIGPDITADDAAPSSANAANGRRTTDDDWIRRVLRQQGSIVVEQRLHKTADFALEFWLDGQGGVEYKGLSLFYTDRRGAYQGGWVAPERQKLQWLMQYIPLPHLQEIRRWWAERLKSIDYRGPVGIDMMLAREGICPCIEVNWRWTMGLVACLASEQGRYGRMVVEYVYGHYSAEIEAFS